MRDNIGQKVGESTAVFCMMLARERYLTSGEEHEMVGYFLEYHDTRDGPKNTKKPTMDLWVMGQAAPYESLNARSWKSLIQEKNKHLAEDPLI